jgi:hypothetical protein
MADHEDTPARATPSDASATNVQPQQDPMAEPEKNLALPKLTVPSATTVKPGDKPIPTGPAPAARPPQNRVEEIGDAPPAKIQFHIHEFDALRAEILAQVEHSRQLEIYALVGTAAIYAWFATGPTPRNALALWIPPLLAGLGALRSIGTLQRLNELGEYIMSIETKFALDGKAWEHYRAKRYRAEHHPAEHHPAEHYRAEHYRAKIRSSPFLWTAVIFWVLLLGVTLVVACWNLLS